MIGRTLSHYRILQKLGEGGMGVVYRAEDTRLRREVALKFLSDKFRADRQRMARFEREARLLATLNHPNIAQIYGLERSGSQQFLVLELVEGETLAERIARGSVPLDEALPLFAQIAEALNTAHEKRITHRDLKPANVKITPQASAKVLDFGLAIADTVESTVTDLSLSPTLTWVGPDSGVLLGTAPYMSPEQAEGLMVDTRSDIWAFGCCLYEALCGARAFPGKTVLETIARILEREPDWARLPADTPASIHRLLRRALCRRRSQRLQAIGDAILEIEEALTAPEAVRPGLVSIAVLPFLNLSADPENEYFTDGMTEDVIAQLSKIGALKVISRTSVMRFKKREQGLREIASTLGVGTVLEGSVRRAGDRFRIVAQLIDAESDEHLWAETYDRQLTDVFAIQTDVALSIAAALQAELSADEKTRIEKLPASSLEAYQLLLKGRHCLDRLTDEGVRQGLEYLGEAIELDPECALAYTGLALAWVLVGFGFTAGAMSPAEAYSRAADAARKAVALDSELGDAQAILAFVTFVKDFDWEGAERRFKRALELNPGSAQTYAMYALLLSALERHEEAIALLRRAKELDPLVPAHSSDLVTKLLRLGRYDEAQQEAERLIALEPDFPLGHSTLGWAYLMKGMENEGLAELEQAVSAAPGNTMLLAQLGQAYGQAGRTDQARAVLRRLEEQSRRSCVSPYHLAYVYTGLGEQARALDLLERACEERASGVYGLKGSFLFASLRSHPRFHQLLKTMHLE